MMNAALSQQPLVSKQLYMKPDAMAVNMWKFSTAWHVTIALRRGIHSEIS